MNRCFRWKNDVANERGIALIVVLIIVIVMSLIAVSLLGLTATNATMTSVERDYQSAYYIAEAGIHYQLPEMEAAILAAYENASASDEFFQLLENDLQFNTSFSPDGLSFQPSFGKLPEVEMLLEKTTLESETARKYVLSAKGTIGQRSRTSTVALHVEWKEKNSVPGITIPANMALFAERYITLSGGAKINGHVFTNATAANSIELAGGTLITGDIFVGPNASPDVLSATQGISVKEPVSMASTMYFELPPFPAIPVFEALPDKTIATADGSNRHAIIDNGRLQGEHWLANHYEITVDRNSYFREINLSSNNTITLNIGSNDREIVVDRLNIANGHLKINGSGRLTMYIINSITMNSGSTINQKENMENLHIYYKGTDSPSSFKSLTLDGAQKIFGSLFAEDANIILTGGGGFQGNIITGGIRFQIDGGAEAHSNIIYAPNADIHLGGGGIIEGAVIAKSLTASGGASIAYKAHDPGTIPVPGGNNGDRTAATIEDLLTIGPIRENK
ncbi:PilX N-terminal [Evansella caseinilytica]|uniref:PilX N-terminal n=1 Tax=Evansella caseinilytica TaxID=1503961 RepID=A0A1H3PTH7_9BACI|nr:pilus assembly PilX N-terminal domain-containing protein [Evansella caseinilytica]SDZ04346.1 PilX N-terminal [Evansella caseinilytica]